MKAKNKFWQFRDSVDGAELLLYGNISDESWWGDEVTPRQFAEELNTIPAGGSITVRINSGGGDVFAAQAIGNLLEARGNVEAKIDGLCASAATIVACHCNKVTAANDSTYMIHPVQLGIFDYADEKTLQEYLNALTTIKESIVNLYARKTGHEKDEVTEWMDATSWWTAAEAKENGFVDELTDEGESPEYENRNGVLFVNSVVTDTRIESAPEFVRDRVKRIANIEPADMPEKQEGSEMEIKTVDDLRTGYPALVDQIEKTAAQSAVAAERERIKEIKDMALPGSETLAEKAMFEDTMSASDFAKAMVKNAKEQGAMYLANVIEDTGKSGVNGVNNAPPENADEFLAAIRQNAKK